MLPQCCGPGAYLGRAVKSKYASCLLLRAANVGKGYCLPLLSVKPTIATFDLAVAGVHQGEIEIKAQQNVLVVTDRKSDSEERHCRPVGSFRSPGGERADGVRSCAHVLALRWHAEFLGKESAGYR
ncbi:hypothetical protein EP837_03043 [Sphingobium sp. EP60837]|nr:hypothetical protein EP837_03043 [Sphingobium sp. EP60837]